MLGLRSGPAVSVCLLARVHNVVFFRLARLLETIAKPEISVIRGACLTTAYNGRHRDVPADYVVEAMMVMSCRGQKSMRAARRRGPLAVNRAEQLQRDAALQPAEMRQGEC